MREANVLVVEDDDTIRQLLIEYLHGHSSVRVDGARDGVEALHEMAGRRYAVIILDVLMPKMSGVDLLTSIEAMMSDPSVKSLDRPPAVIIITATNAATLPDDELPHRFPQLVRAVFRKPLKMQALAR